MRGFHNMRFLTRKLNNLEKKRFFRKEHIVIIADDILTLDFVIQGAFTSKEEYEAYLQWRCDSIAEEYDAGLTDSCVMAPNEHDIALHIQEFRTIRPPSGPGSAIVMHLPVELVKKYDLGNS